METKNDEKAIRLQRRSVERRKEDVITAARALASGDARALRGDLVLAIHDYDEAARRLAEMQPRLDLLLASVPHHPDHEREPVVSEEPEVLY